MGRYWQYAPNCSGRLFFKTTPKGTSEEVACFVICKNIYLQQKNIEILSAYAKEEIKQQYELTTDDCDDLARYSVYKALKHWSRAEMYFANALFYLNDKRLLENKKA